MSTVEHLLNEGTGLLKKNNIPNSVLDAQLLLSHVLNVSWTSLFLAFDQVVDEDVHLSYRQLIHRRSQSEPLAYLVKRKEFYSTDFYINSHVLIPRPETELLVQLAVDKIKQNDFKTVLDVGCGSGVIGLSIKKLVPNIDITMVDLSEDALAVAKKNADLLGLEVELFQSDLFQNVHGQYDMVVANLPYIDANLLHELEVSKHEPIMALNGFKDGLVIVFQCIEAAKNHLHEGGCLGLEIGIQQHKKVLDHLKAFGYQELEVFKDYQQVDRVIWGQLGAR